MSKADTVDNYQLYINNILVRNDSGFPNKSNQSNFLTLDKAVYNTTIDIYFNHCTGGATNRRIIVVSRNKRNIIGWQFPDENTQPLMRVPISRIRDKIKTSDTEFYELYYYDDQTKEGRLLTRFKIS